MAGQDAYEPPEVWKWNPDSNQAFANINRPTAGAQQDKELQVTYMESVRESVQDSLSNMTDNDLDRPLSPDNPRLTVGRQIQSIVVGHGFFHLGEIRFLKGLQGMPFPR